MPPKTKQGKNDWIHCTKCDIYITTKHFLSHITSCEERNIEASDKVSASKCGFIKNNTLLAFSKEVTNDKVSDLPRKYRETMILLHPVTLRQLNVSLGDWVVLEHHTCVLVWPDNSLALDSIGMCLPLRNDLKCSADEILILYKRVNSLVGASYINLYTDSREEFVTSLQFSKFLLQLTDGRSLTAGNKINASYFGKGVQLHVRNIGSSENNTVTENDNTSLSCSFDGHASLHFEDISQHMDSLNISDISDTSICTPVLKNKTRKSYHRHSTQFYTVTKNTVLKVITPGTDVSSTGLQGVHRKKEVEFCSVGGYKSQNQCIQELLDRTFSVGSIIGSVSNLFISPRGVLLYGPSGCGKTLIVKALLKEYPVKKVVISGPEIWSKYFGESEARIKLLFEEAREQAPSIIVIDELDTLCPRRETSQNDVEKRVLAALISQIDDVLSGERPVFLLAVTSKRDHVDVSLRRPGRLDRELEIGVPTAAERKQILEVHVADIEHTLTQTDLTDVADSAHGFVGADLAVLCKEAGLHAARRDSGSTRVSVTHEDLVYGLQTVQPSAMREVAIEVPNVRWADIGGQEELKHKLRQAVEWPLKHPEAFLRLGIRPPKGLLMYGPPGCSKTMIAKALAKESGINFIAIKGPELFSKWVGESERAVRELFRKARAAAPAIVFFDEIDALAGERGSGGSGGGEVSDRVLAQLLTEMDGVEVLQDVTIVAATNRPDRIDKALLRPGRLDRIVYVPLPDAKTRQEIFRILFKKMPIAAEVDVEKLVEGTISYSGAEVSAVCHEAALSAMQEDINITQISSRNFSAALEVVTPRITQELIQFYDTYAQNSGLHSV